jgi:hypothetical protein
MKPPVSDRPGAADRRLHGRVPVVGNAIVLTPERYVGTFLIENISAEGALLAGDSQLEIGDQVRVLLQIHGTPRIGVRGKIVRRAERAGQHLFALTFRASASAQDLLQAAALRQIEAEPVTLVAEEDRDVCHALTCELRLMGRNALAVHTPMHAIGWLHAPGIRIEAVAIGCKFADMDGIDLLEFIALDFPSIQRAVIVTHDGPLARAPQAAILRRPWSREALTEAFPDTAP